MSQLWWRDYYKEEKQWQEFMKVQHDQYNQRRKNRIFKIFIPSLILIWGIWEIIKALISN